MNLNIDWKSISFKSKNSISFFEISFDFKICQSIDMIFFFSLWFFLSLLSERLLTSWILFCDFCSCDSISFFTIKIRLWKMNFIIRVSRTRSWTLNIKNKIIILSISFFNMFLNFFQSRLMIFLMNSRSIWHFFNLINVICVASWIVTSKKYFSIIAEILFK